MGGPDRNKSQSFEEMADAEPMEVKSEPTVKTEVEKGGWLRRFFKKW